MRALFFIIMIALLPLRGWAGEVMATDMASAQVMRAHLPEHMHAHEQANKQTHSQGHDRVEFATQKIAAGARIHWARGTFGTENAQKSFKTDYATASTLQ